MELSLAGRWIHHYPKVERLRRNATAYKQEHGSDYFEDLHTIHASLGLDIPLEGTRAFASLSPLKEKELVVIGSKPGDESLSRAVGALLQGYVEDLGVRAFNVAFYMPPLAPDGRLYRGPRRSVQPYLGHGGDGTLRGLRCSL